MTWLLSPRNPAAILALAVAALLWLLIISGAPIPVSRGTGMGGSKLLELIALTVAAGIFVIGWLAIDQADQRRPLLLGCTFLSVAVFNAASLITSDPTFVFDASHAASKSALYSLISRYLAALSLLLTFTVMTMKQAGSTPPPRLIYLLGTLSLTLGMWLAVTLYADHLLSTTAISPHATQANRSSAALLLLALIISTAIFWQRHEGYADTSPALISSAILLGISESFFVFGPSGSDLGQLAGQLFKATAYIYVLKTLMIDGVQGAIEKGTNKQQFLHAYSAKMDELFNDAPDGILILGYDGSIRYCNQTALQMFGYSREELLGNKVEMLIPASLRSRHEEHRAGFQKHRVGRPMALQRGLVARCKNGYELPVDIALGKLSGQGSAGITAFIRDTSERNKIEQDNQYRATHDLLTRLPNRTLFHDRLERAIVKSRRNNDQFALFMIDLDNFREINEGWGHSLGDLLLVNVANRLSRALREGDTLARFGGDEFVVLVSDIRMPDNVNSVVQKIMDTLAIPFVIGPHQFNISASVGIAHFPEHAHDTETLLSHADLAMYRAKAAGRGTVRYYDETMSKDQQETLLIKTMLHEAITLDQLSVYYQPQYRIADRRIIGFEALIRWTQGDGSSVPPDAFIPIAEQSGLIIPLTEFVITQACAQLRRWSDAGLTTSIAINISAMHFRQRGELLNNLRSAIATAGVDPGLLRLELTETALMTNSDIAAETLRELVAMGIKIALDDFGTGYSSLSALQLYPLHMLKIDRSFMRELSASKRNMAIISGLVSLAGGLGLEVLAEGVETLEQYELLSGCGCDSFQGTLLSPALPADECTRLLTDSETGLTSSTADNSPVRYYQAD